MKKQTIPYSPSWLSTGTVNWLSLWHLQTFVSNKERV